MNLEQLMEKKKELKESAEKVIERCDNSINDFDIRKGKNIFHIFSVAIATTLLALLLFHMFGLVNTLSTYASIAAGITVGVAKTLFLRWGHKELTKTREDMCRMVESEKEDIEKYENLT